MTQHAYGRSSGSGSPAALAGRRVLDLTNESGVYCTKLLADMGADVVMVEGPGGNPTRGLDPYWHDNFRPEKSLYFLYYNTNKRSVTLDIRTAAGRGAFLRLVATADLVVETLPPGYLDSIGLGYAALAAANPRLVLTSVAPFGQTGPYRGYKANDLIAQAMGGLAFITGDPETPPLKVAGLVAYHVASTYAAIGSMAALRQAEHTGQGQHVDVSLQEAVATCLEYVGAFYGGDRLIARRHGSDHPLFAPRIVFRCSDGFISFHPSRHWDDWVRWMGSEGMAQDLAAERLTGPQQRRIEREHLNAVIEPWARRHPRAELFLEGQRKQLAFAPVYSPDEMTRDPQLAARAFFVQVDHPERGQRIAYPGAPYMFSETPWRIRRPAPRIGEHNREVLEGELGHSPQQAQRPPTFGAAASRASPAAPNPTGTTLKAAASGRRPLQGIRIVDLTWVLAGPVLTRVLADLGAEVVKVEMRETGDLRRSGTNDPSQVPGVNRNPDFNNVNRNKLSITLDWNHPEGRQALRQLVSVSDVVVENFSAGVMERKGLGYEDLKKTRPDVVMVSLAGMGQAGPYAGFVSLGPTIQALSGITYLTGYPGRLPVGPGSSVSDYLGGLTGAVAVLIALDYRGRTGHGQYVDLSQLEASCAVMGTHCLDYIANGKAQQPVGNRTPYGGASVHGVFRCQGDDRWCAIAVFTDDEWTGLRRAMGEPAWSTDPRFATLQGRLQHTAKLEELIGGWTSCLEAGEVMRRLQSEGVPAGVVQSGEDLMARDPQLRHRGFYTEWLHPEVGRVAVDTLPFLMSAADVKPVRGAPLLGEHNDYVYGQLLGLAESTINRWIVGGVL